MLLDDFVHDEQAQPRSLAHVLGRKEGVEYPGERVRRDAGAGVVYLDIHRVFFERALAAVLEVIIDAGLVLDLVVRAVAVRLYGYYSSPLRHRVERILDQIQKGLLYALLVDGNGKIRRDVDADRRVCGYLPLDEAKRLLEKLPQRQALFLEILVAGEFEQRAHDVPRAVALVVDLRQQVVHEFGVGQFLPRSLFPGFLQLLDQDLVRRRNVRERVVQFVRHAGQERSQGSEFFRLDQVALPQLQFAQHLVESVRERRDLPVPRVDPDLFKPAVRDHFHVLFDHLERLHDHAGEDLPDGDDGDGE